ncbi:MAG: hypothetical protein VYA30_14505 [Myxococcota bacterium]|nr:hypothetical protein [Myxococcota bacterium]
MKPAPLFLLVGLVLSNTTFGNAKIALGEFETVRDQGILYLKRGLPKLAFVELNKVYSTPAGERDFMTLLNRGRAALLLLKLDVAAAMIEASFKVAKTIREKRQLQQLNDDFRNDFGSVRVSRLESETRESGMLVLEMSSSLINKRKRERYLSVKTRLNSAPVTLPARIFLPHGTYRINGADFKIADVEDEPEISVFLEEASEPTHAMNSTWWWVGSGIAAAAVVGITAIMLLDEPEPQYREYFRLELE